MVEPAKTALSQKLEQIWLGVKNLYWSSPRTTFFVLPLTVIVLETIRRRRLALPDLRFSPLLAWGYLQYRLVSTFRLRLSGGARGMAGLPDSLVTSGPYRLTRNPMYLGHLIYSAGLVLTFRSPVAMVLAATRVIYFQMRVTRDEARLEKLFGAQYVEYRQKVKRWIPGLL